LVDTVIVDNTAPALEVAGGRLLIDGRRIPVGTRDLPQE
jgi:uncharacterized protein (DUF433 family)